MKNKALPVHPAPETTQNWAKRWQISGRSTQSHTQCAAFLAVPVILLIVIFGCGTGGVDPHNVTVTISTAEVTIPANVVHRLSAVG